MVRALADEIRLQKDFLPEKNIGTIYFGGGTPSVLRPEEITFLIDTIDQHFQIDSGAEITLEANPDDLDKQGLSALRSTAVNRLSIGIQSFYEQDLLWMNRSHTAHQATDSVRWAQDVGLENITIDLIYGVPGMTEARWADNLRQAFDLEVPHLSAYCLTVEERTALADFIRKGKTTAPTDQLGSSHFNLLMDLTEKRGYVHYEISNFCLPGKHSRHNSNYWKGISYLGIGPSAHSYKKGFRQWNVANNIEYIKSIGQGKVPCEFEELSELNQLNEYLMISLRTREGIELKQLGNYRSDTLAAAEPALQSGHLQLTDSHLFLTQPGKHFADRIASDLFITDTP